VKALETDVVVVGAGAAGLAAARALHAHEIDFVLLEARDRVGGRAYTVRSHDGEVPIELGAEFIHGAAKSTRAIMREIGEAALPTDAPSFTMHRGHLEPSPDTWEVAERVLRHVDIHGTDQSVAGFLDTIPHDELSLEQRARLRALVEGFDAALVHDASIIGIAKEWRSGVNDFSHRPAHGYGPIMEHLEQLVAQRLFLRTVVTQIRWSVHDVQVEATRDGDAVRISAHRAIVTVPIGVLHHDTALFAPELPPEKRAALDAIAMGPVIKVELEFAEPFWKYAENGRYRHAAFFRAPECQIQTLWSPRYAEPAPLLFGWAGGGAAQRLIDRGVDPIRAALDTAAALFPEVDIKAKLRNAYFHDWQADPFACGAYSYLRVGAGNARERFAQPIEDTLFFAGEAASIDDAGTVAGAFDTGYSCVLSITK
jgi:monoamine oxidase